jgi:hypothetical protein
MGLRSSRHDPYKLGYTRVTMLVLKGSKNLIWSKSQKSKRSSDCTAETRLHEDGIVSNRRSARYGEYLGVLYTPPVTSGE